MSLITDRQKQVLKIIAASKLPLSCQEIGDMIEATRQRVNYIQQRLHKKGLITKRYNEFGSIKLTKKGREIL